MNQDNVPMMFRAQIDSRCQIHRIERNKGTYQDAHKWVNEWTKGVFPTGNQQPNINPSTSSFVSRPQPRHKKNPATNPATARSTPNNPAFARPTQATAPTLSQDTPLEFPKFGLNVKTWEYTISWRLVTNSGQDESVILPVINAKGFPYFPGTSMKGAFRRVCIDMYGNQQTNSYCGEKLADGSSKPGILRFHGAYPVSMDWTQGLVDVIHCQEEKQVISDDFKDGAKTQISLRQVKLRFGISSTQKLSEDEWKKIENIWKKTLAMGIGSRVSAGYGYFKEIEQEVVKDNLLFQVKLKGQGGTSQLVDRTKEFRPNMFKAALRGHTLRLLGGLTNEATAKDITRELWGGFSGDGSIVGLLGVNFDFDPSQIKYEDEKRYYQLHTGVLKIFCMHRQIDDVQRQRLRETAKALIQFSLMLGGFGKSWRRICHKEFYRSYKRQTIGCHWEFLDDTVYYPIINLKEDVAELINHTRNLLRLWIPKDKQVNRDLTQSTKLSNNPSINTPGSPKQVNNIGLISRPKRPQNPIVNLSTETSNTGIEKWREAWYSPKVQVWGRKVEDGKSLAIDWLHYEYRGKDTIRNPHVLAGGQQNSKPMSTGRIWHRMYPNFVTNEKALSKTDKEFIEVLTIFPDTSQQTLKFLEFLENESEFSRVW
ncbi:RAMP superfamily CRISPR-associated protein [Scytonema sp. NUACC26]|uniref:RAMP superfamily CRISPR-associated protein n=1 Tax=Scytonema sp. NUACC26 TaxID=3140176 RepID=UPI0034DC2F91